MLAFIRGTLYKKTQNGIIIEAGGIGYYAYASVSTIRDIGSVGDTVLIHTYMKTAEDGITLYGFLSDNELKMFNYLLSVSGIGPKNALSVLSHMSPDSVVIAVLSEDAQALSKAQGIGKKTALRIILDLKDKFKADNLVPAGVAPQQSFEMANAAVSEAIEALAVLGYTQSESVKAVLSVSEDGLSSSRLIKLALKKLAQ